MIRYRHGNPKRQSRFICLKCMKENMLATGIQRNHSQREKGHVKDLFCLRCGFVTKNEEVRYCDVYEEIYEDAKIKSEYYYADERKVG